MRTEYWNDCIAPQRMRYALFGVVLQEGSCAGMINVVRRQDARPFEDENVALLYVLLPHLKRALQLYLRIAGLELQKKAATDALNRWHMGVILVNAHGEVLLVNRAAEAILNQKDGLGFGPGGLQGATPRETNSLRALVHSAVQARSHHDQHSGSNLPPGGLLLLPRPSFKRSLSVLVAPVCPNDRLFPQTGAAAAVFIGDPEAAEQTSEEVLHQFFGLSPAEAGVAALLIQGKNMHEVADELEITLNTARTHLKQVFEKTGTKRQAELVRLLLQSPAALSLELSRKPHPFG